jgi:hypothetical protein
MTIRRPVSAVCGRRSAVDGAGFRVRFGVPVLAGAVRGPALAVFDFAAFRVAGISPADDGVPDFLRGVRLRGSGEPGSFFFAGIT